MSDIRNLVPAVRSERIRALADVLNLCKGVARVDIEVKYYGDDVRLEETAAIVEAAGKDVCVWTVNDPVHMSRMVSRGVDGLITDEPALARQVLAERAKLSSVERLLLEGAFFLGAVPSEPPATEDLD